MHRKKNQEPPITLAHAVTQIDINTLKWFPPSPHVFFLSRWLYRHYAIWKRTPLQTHVVTSIAKNRMLDNASLYITHKSFHIEKQSIAVRWPNNYHIRHNSVSINTTKILSRYGTGGKLHVQMLPDAHCCNWNDLLEAIKSIQTEITKNRAVSNHHRITQIVSHSTKTKLPSFPRSRHYMLRPILAPAVSNGPEHGPICQEIASWLDRARTRFKLSIA